MALFGGNEKTSKKQENLLNKYGLENVNVKDAESIQKILDNLKVSGAIKASIALSSAKTEEKPLLQV